MEYHQATVRFTKEQWQKVLSDAKQRGLSVASWLRLLALEGKNGN